MVIQSPKLVYLFALWSGKSSLGKATVFYPFIFISNKNDIPDWLLRHERIHLRQQSELLIIGSLLLNSFEYLFACFVLHKTSYDVYLWTSAEQESYLNQHNEHYLDNRRMFQRFKYILDKRHIVTRKDGTVEIN
ncbi:hypothetical protein CO026_01005 [Candidatus Kaiserbacteria bacterium CG_4_9_14_0_2_um_filter_41_32]|uniref:Uncharacterized protein n=1 Tax=Candidatus Kaiserbacteria bacterium CG_4_9_14_0_2_um_filter_41_32 TaxID=1974601 RepID=A0A2M8FFC8_9BACT|nr:MAG: hypothetical protein CO026_01005 [Candidatus Kaiserbacteria bacterium CG_4_9_14_0_2_um_filter_41_32]